ncbi:MAG: FAD-binding protein, partial [Acidiferrobacterales bacterium]
MITVADQSRLRGKLLFDEPMAKHTSWRVGGPADCFYVPADLTDLQLFLATQPSAQPIYWLGLGSNLLVRNGGVRGTVVATSGALDDLRKLDEQRVRAEAGVPCAKVARFTVTHGLAGAHFLAGIPGTVGGALAMNAGAFGGETWTIVDAVETIDRQ